MGPKENLQQFHTFYDNLPGGVCIIRDDPEETLLFANKGLLALFQCSSLEELQQLTGGEFRGLVDPADYHPLDELTWQDSSLYVSFRIRTSQGHFRRLEGVLKKTELPGTGPAYVLALLSNLQKASSMKQDSVTGLMGLHAFYQQAKEKAVQKSRDDTLPDFCPVYLNLSNFKLYNMAHGLQAGDRLLRFIAQTLQQNFPDQLMARMSGDSFALLAASHDLLPALTKTIQTVDQAIGSPTITLKAGIFQTQKGQSAQLMLHTFDMAQLACNSIKRDATRSYAFYTPELEQELQLRAFVLENFQKALDQGHIQVYYQPVIRSLTGKLCGLEALARWNDPEKGLISPGVFVPILEDTRLIHKLDAYVLEQVARRLKAHQLNHQPLLPISCNFSRLDFILSDPFQLVETITQKYGLPRDLLCIELTESALVHDSYALKKALDNFHRAGYQLWLDDFGSAYSALNVLHNYHFDELKIDMGFWQDLNEKGKKIITSIVLMAKTLGVHTLAEGVETRQQVEFLKKIGCEKIQGYYYGKPMDYEALLHHLQLKGTLAESSLERPLYEKAGLLNILTDAPVALFRYDGEKMTLLSINEAYRNVLRSIGTRSLSAGNRELHAYDFPAQQKLRTFLDKTLATDQEHSMIYVDNGQYLRLRVRKLAEGGGLFLGRAELHNITFDQKTRQANHFDKLLRNLLQQYDGILYMDLEQDTLHVLETTNPGIQGETAHAGIRKFFTAYAEEYVYREDRQRFLEFFQPENLHHRARISGRSETADLFRIRQHNGNYTWMIFHAIVLRKDLENNVLVCVRQDLWERKDSSFHRSLLPVFTASLGYPVQTDPAQKEKNLPVCFWENALQNAPLKYFWKDNCRRFLGASQSFLDFYGLKLDDLLGRTDEDMGWHPDPEPFRQDELKVLLKGATLRNRLGHCIVQGVPHTILATKYPMYKENKIVGLIGYFLDLDSFPGQQPLLQQLDLRDPDTGFLSYRGLLESGFQYEEAWQRRGQDYLGFSLIVPEYEAFSKQYGEPMARALLDRVTRLLKGLDLHETSLARTSNCCFLGLTQNLDVETLQQKLQRLAREVRSITQIKNYPCTLSLRYVLARGSETHSLDNLLLLLSERINQIVDQNYGHSIFIGDRIAFDLAKFDTMDELVMISDPQTFEMVYMNRAALEAFHLKGPEDYKGQKCYQLLEDREAPCASCPRNLLRQDRFHTMTYHNIKSGLDLLLRDTLVPWRGRTLHFVLGLNLNKYVDMDIARNQLLYREASINDVIAIGLREEDPDAGIQKMIDNLARTMGAERFYIFEENPDGTISATYEWKRKGLLSLKGQLQHLPKHVAQPLYDAFDREQMAMLPDVEAYVETIRKKHHGFRPTIPNIHSLVSGHLTQGNRSLGFTEVINPSAETFQSASLVLATVTRFFAIMLRNRNNRRKLEHSSRTDALTGLGNRYAFREYVEQLESGRTFLFLYGDINGLKRENDQKGHKAGDQLIIKASRTLEHVQGRGRVFRMGGDEFLLVTPVADDTEAQKLLARLKALCRQAGISVALGYALTHTPITDLDALLSRADHNMYKDKGVLYGRRSTDR